MRHPSPSDTPSFILLDGLSAESAGFWLNQAVSVSLHEGDILFREGEPGDSVYLVAEGALDVLRDDDGIVLAQLEPGAHVGAMAVVDGQPRSATLRARARAMVLQLPGHLFLPDADPPEQARVLVNLLREHAEQTRSGNDRQVSALRQQLEGERIRVQLGVFLTQVIALMCLYGLTLNAGIAMGERHGHAAVFSTVCLLAYALILGWLMHRSGEPWSAWGVTWKGWLGAAARGTLWTLPLLAATIVAKAVLIHSLPSWQDEPLFVFSLQRDAWPPSELILLITYLLFVPVQEFTARAGLQGSLTRFLPGKHVHWKANVLANLMFAASHVHLGTMAAILVMGPGLFWGWLMHREGNLWAPILSHSILGVWAYWVLGVPGL